MMVTQANRKAWERIQQNEGYREAYREWVGRQFIFYKFTGGFYAWERTPLNEAGREYANSLYEIMLTGSLTQDDDYKEAISEAEDLNFLDAEFFSWLKERASMIAGGIKGGFSAVGGRAEFVSDFETYLNISMSGVWLRLIDTVRPDTPFMPGLWPLDPDSDYEEVKKHDLIDPNWAASLIETSEDGREITVKIDLQMPDKYILERIKAMAQGLREKHGIKKTVGSGTLAGMRRGMLGVSEEISQRMAMEFQNHKSVAQLTRDYYDQMKKEDDQPLSDFIDITESRIYRKIYRWSKTL